MNFRFLIPVFFGMILLLQPMSMGNYVSAQTVDDISLPSWFKNNAIWWSQGIISDDDIINALENLIENDVIPVEYDWELSDNDSSSDDISHSYNLSDNESSSVNPSLSVDNESCQTNCEPVEIPSYIKTVFQYWGDDLVSDDEIGNSLKFLIKENIIGSEKILEKKQEIKQQWKVPPFMGSIEHVNGVWIGYDPCLDGQMTVSWTLSEEKWHHGMIIRVTDPLGNKMIDYLSEEKELEMGLISYEKNSEIPGEWKFEIVNVDPEFSHLLFDDDPKLDLNHLDDGRRTYYTSLNLPILESSTIYVTHPPCKDFNQNDDSAMKKSSESIQDDLLEVAPLYIVDKQMTHCDSEFVMGYFELSRENGGNVGFTKNSEVTFVAEHVETGYWTTYMFDASVDADSNIVRFWTSPLGEGTWKIYPNSVTVVPVDLDDVEENNPELLERALISAESGYYNTVLVSGEPILIEMPCSYTLETTEYDYQCIGHEIHLNAEYKIEFRDAPPILDGFYPLFLITNLDTRERSEVTAGYGKDVHENKIDVTLPPLDTGRYKIELSTFESDSNPDDILLIDNPIIFEIEIPCGTQTDGDNNETGIQNDYSTNAQCTEDAFGYGKINVLDSWGSYSALGEDAGYVIHWGWSFAYDNSQYSTDGILVNFDPQGPFTYGPPESWSYAYGGQLELTGWTATSGTYTFDIIDFENLGAYCGDGDTITIIIP